MAGNQTISTEFGRIFTIVKQDLDQAILFDNVTTRVAYLFRLNQVGAIVRSPSKVALDFAIQKELVAAQAITDLDLLNIIRADPVTRARYEWKTIVAPVHFSNSDMLKTADDAIIDYVEMLVQTAESAVRESLAGNVIGLFSALTESDRGFTGLQTFFSITPTTGTVGGVNRATLAVWRNQAENVSSDFSANGITGMLSLHLNCSRGDENIDTIVFNKATYQNYITALTGTLQMNMPMMANTYDQQMLEAGFPNIGHYGAIVIFDDGVIANRGYFLNLKKKYTHLILHEKQQFELTDLVRPKDQLALVGHVVVSGAQVCTNQARQGVLYNSDIN